MSSVIDSYSESNQNAYTGYYGSNNDWVGQSFYCESACTLTSIKVYLLKNNVPTGNLYIKVFAHDGTYGTSSVGTGSVLATSDNVSIAGLSTSWTLVEFTFSGGNQISLTADTPYVFVIDTDDMSGSASRYVYIGFDSSSPSHSGNYTVYMIGYEDWSPSVYFDMCFYVYGDLAETPTTSIKELIGFGIIPSPR